MGCRFEEKNSNGLFSEGKNFFFCQNVIFLIVEHFITVFVMVRM